VFAAIFFCTSMLEIFGTGFGNWRWAANAPYLLFPSGNPPSVIAGGYCVIDGTVLLLASLLGRLPELPRPWQRSPAVDPLLVPEQV